MSKLYKKYLKLKENKNIIYVFRVGIFYILIDEDALSLSNLLGLKCTKLNDSIYKCGFPVDSGSKYFKKMDILNIEYQVIDNLTSEENFSELNKVLDKIKLLDINNITGVEAINILNALIGVLNGRIENI